jgi:predicted secreted protein
VPRSSPQNDQADFNRRKTMSHASRRVHVSLPRTAFAAFFLLAAGLGFAASPLTVNLSSQASRPASNDLMQATLFAEADGDVLAELSGRINQIVADALKLAKTYPAVKVQSGGTSTSPVYAKYGEIESWRMRSAIALQSGDTASLSELLGKLQTSLAVSSLRMLPSPETQRKAEDAAILDAIDLFKARAKLLADAQRKNYSIKELTVETESHSPIMPAPRVAQFMSLSSNATPMPIESGESEVSASVSGKIELE